MTTYKTDPNKFPDYLKGLRHEMARAEVYEALLAAFNRDVRTGVMPEDEDVRRDYYIVAKGILDPTWIFSDDAGVQRRFQQIEDYIDRLNESVNGKFKKMDGGPCNPGLQEWLADRFRRETYTVKQGWPFGIERHLYKHYRITDTEYRQLRRVVSTLYVVVGYLARLPKSHGQAVRTPAWIPSKDLPYLAIPRTVQEYSDNLILPHDSGENVIRALKKILEYGIPMVYVMDSDDNDHKACKNYLCRLVVRVNGFYVPLVEKVEVVA